MVLGGNSSKRDARLRSLVKILIVDDSLTDRLIVKALLGDSELSAEVSECDSVNGAIRAMDAQRFDCVLTDYRLPDGSGLDVVGHAGERACPTVVFTGLDDAETAINALERGAQDYLVKGEFDAGRLARCIRYAIARRRVGELERRLVHAERLATVGRLAAGVAHEVNNPLTYLLANATTIGDRADAVKSLLVDESHTPAAAADPIPTALAMLDEIVLMADEAQGGIKRIARIVQGLKQFSRAPTDRVRPLSVHGPLEAACTLIAADTTQNVNLVKELNCSIAIDGDEERLTQLFLNLLLNAAQAIAAGSPSSPGTVRIKTHNASDGVQVAIEDDGPGIPEEIRPRIFDAFFTTTARDGGSGLGLTLCKEIATEHGGRLVVGPAPERGTRVELFLPRSQAQLSPDEVSKRSPLESPPSQRARVMFIDDEELVCASLKRMLEKVHEVETFTDGELALRRLSEDPAFDAVLCDVTMPGMDGADVYHGVVDISPTLASKFLFLTGGVFSPETAVRLEAIECPMLDKPPDKQTLLETIQKMMQRQGERKR